MRRGVLLFVTGMVVGGMVAPTVVIPAIGQTTDAVRSAATGGTTMWANATTIDDALDRSDPYDLSNADRNGSVHVAYAVDGTLYYARLTTRGRVETTTELGTLDNDLRTVEVVAEPDGHAHVLYQSTGGFAQPPVYRTVVGRNGEPERTHVAVEASGDGVRLLNTTRMGAYQRVHAVVEVGGNFELVSLDDDTDSATSGVIADSSRAVNVVLASRNESLYAVAGDGEDVGGTASPFTVHTYDLSSTAVEDTGAVDIEGSGFADDTAVWPTAVAAYRDGILAIAGKESELGSNRYVLNVVNVPQATTTESPELDRRVEEAVVDAGDRLYLTTGDGYLRFSADLRSRTETGLYTGGIALNRDGYPSLLRWTARDGLRYRPMVVRGTGQFEDLYARFASVNEALVAENARLRNTSVDVTVRPGDGTAQGFAVGGSAEVTVDAQSVDPSDVTVRYRNATYAPDENGRLSIPLEEPGRRNLTVSHGEMSERVTLNVSEDRVTIPPPVVGDAAPNDPDGDGRYEDVNGDGSVTPGDATVLFDAVFAGNAAVTDHAARYDFNGDGSVTPGDATVLFGEVF